MNIYPEQLESMLANPAGSQLNSVYLVSGDEPLQIMEATDSIRNACREQGYGDREIFDVDAGFDWQLFNEEAASMSLFSSQRILDVRLPSGKPGRQGSEAIKQYLVNPPEDTILIITAGKLDKGAKNSAWYKAIDQKGAVIQCWPVPLEKLHTWVRKRFQSRDMQPEAEVVDYVCQHVEGNMLAAAQEIDKIHLLVGPGAVNFESVREAITDNSRYSVFELVDVAMNGDASRVLKIANSLAAEGVEPLAVIWVFAKELRLLCSAASDPSTAEYTLSRSGVWRNRMPLFRNCLARHSEKSLQSLLKRCAKIDAVSKGFEAGNAWDELRMLAFLLASGRSHAKNRRNV
jgi:DNA polymerase-3 subunit delta